MRLHQFAAVMLLAGTSTFLVSCGGTESTAADEAAIKAANTRWMELIVAKDGKTIAGEIYSENGIMLPPNAPRVTGRDALEKSWTGLVNIPGIQLTFDTDSLTFAKSGELAVEVGHYNFGMGDGATKSSEIGKTVVTWTRKDGKWQVLTDMFSSDAPAMPAPAAAPATPETTPTDASAPAPAAATGTAPAPAAPAAATPSTSTAPPAH